MRDRLTGVLDTVTSCGRHLVGRSFGPSDGVPVLFVAGAATGKSMSFGATVLEEKGVRVLTMDRPGMGQSTFDAHRTLMSTAADYRAFMSEAVPSGGPPMPVIAHSQGAMFGVAIALSGGASSLTLVSPADEVMHPVIHRMLPPEAAHLPDLVRSAPNRARQVLGSFTPAAMEEMVLAGAHRQDRDAYQDPYFLSRYRAALDEGFANDGAAYVQDTFMAMQRWGVDLSEVTCPVDIFFGGQDEGHSPDLGETLATRFPVARRTVMAEAGGALLWTHAELILEQVLARRL